jgi:tripartite-type tricarboxylate transporter receptor subunit TctC
MSKKRMLLGLVSLILIFVLASAFGCGPGAEEEGNGDPGNEAGEDIDFPNKALNLVVGATAGGSFDTQARVISEHWPKYLPANFPIVVNNVDGAGGLVSANQGWVAAPDGYTIIQLKMGPYLLNEQIYPDEVQFEMAKWEYIGQYLYNVNVLAVRKAVAEEIKSYTDLVNYAQEKPLVIGSAGVGSAGHTNGIIISNAAGIDAKYVQYAAGAEVQGGLLRGEVDFAIYSTGLISKWDLDEVRPLVVFADEITDEIAGLVPGAVLPEDFGFPQDVTDKILGNPVFSSPLALALPPGTPSAVVQILRDSFEQMLNDQDFVQAFAQAQQLLMPIKGEEFEALIPSLIQETKEIVPVIKEALE